MPLYYGTHNKLERGQFRVDAIPQPIQEGGVYPDSGNILLFEGWRGILAHAWMCAGVCQSLLNRTNGEGNIMLSFNKKDYDELHGPQDGEIVPD